MRGSVSFAMAFFQVSLKVGAARAALLYYSNHLGEEFWGRLLLPQALTRRGCGAVMAAMACPINLEKVAARVARERNEAASVARLSTTLLKLTTVKSHLCRCAFGSATRFWQQPSSARGRPSPTGNTASITVSNRSSTALSSPSERHVVGAWAYGRRWAATEACRHASEPCLVLVQPSLRSSCP